MTLLLVGRTEWRVDGRVDD